MAKMNKTRNTSRYDISYSFPVLRENFQFDYNKHLIIIILAVPTSVYD
jgi:hypothetical protein